ncbi:MAG: MarR family EPS-associated transcriptional regulator [Thermodesulfobacteriota bacterium]|nr:MarR family EPS-associated transcriptional regulator [Thermodesulfobacteriota bacterium]
MNHTYEQEIRYRLLKILAEEPQLGQREMAKKMGVSLGKVNFCVSELAARGWIKITRLKSARKKIPYIYMLTPRGLEAKTKITLAFLKRKLSEYEEVKYQIAVLTEEVEKNGLQDMAESGIGEMAGRII